MSLAAYVSASSVNVADDKVVVIMLAKLLFTELNP